MASHWGAMGPTVALALICAAKALSGEAPSTSDQERADDGVVRLPPEAFDELPVTVKAELASRDCTIPQIQPTGSANERNVVRGEFTRSGQIDIAVLCSRKRVSTILVFRGGSTSDIAEIARSSDRIYLQDVGAGRIEFSRLLGVADADFIRERHAVYGGPQPPPLDHEGIADIFVEKASWVWYWYQGRWLELTGSD